MTLDVFLQQNFHRFLVHFNYILRSLLKQPQVGDKVH